MLGIRVGQELEPGDVMALRGELGCGKTLFTRGIARGMGVSPRVPVTSPTFTIINEYEGRLHLYHLDLYRLASLEDLEDLPWREVVFGAGVSVIEWPDRMEGLLPAIRWGIEFEFLDDDRRSICFTFPEGSNEARFEKLARELTEIAAQETRRSGGDCVS